MRRALLWTTASLVVACAAATACGGDERPPVAAGGTTTETRGDAGPRAVDADIGNPSFCASPSLGGELVRDTEQEGEAFPPGGGEIALGTYDLVSNVRWVPKGACDADDCSLRFTGTARRATLVVEKYAIRRFEASGPWDEQTDEATLGEPKGSAWVYVETDGGLALTALCPDGNAKSDVAYSASAGSLTFHVGDRLETYARRTFTGDAGF